jgi:hypothetical protein
MAQKQEALSSNPSITKKEKIKCDKIYTTKKTAFKCAVLEY